MKRFNLLSGIYYTVILAVILMISSFAADAAVAGLLIAKTVGGQYTDDMQIFRRNLSTQSMKVFWFRSRISKWISLIDYEKYKNTGTYASAKNSPMPLNQGLIHAFSEFRKQGGTYLDVPVYRPITGQGKVGLQPLKGSGVKRTIFTKKLACNMVRQAVQVQDNTMSAQVLPLHIRKEMMANATPELRDWHSRKAGFEPYFAVLTGYSTNITDPTWGLSKSNKSHPNTFVQGTSSQPKFYTTNGTYSHTAYSFDAGWESWVAAALGTLTASSSRYFKVDSLKNMNYFARQLKIQPFRFNGNDAFVVVITSAQMRQLRDDDEWKAYHKEASERDRSTNPIFSGVSEGYLIEGCYLIVDDTLPAARISGDSDTSVYGEAYDSTRGTINYGRSDFMDEPVDVSPRKPALLLGQAAISMASVNGFQFTEETDDHGELIEHGGKMLYGFERADIIDDDGYVRTAGYLLENSSSLVYWTYSPNSINLG